MHIPNVQGALLQLMAVAVPVNPVQKGRPQLANLLESSHWRPSRSLLEQPQTALLQEATHPAPSRSSIKTVHGTHGCEIAIVRSTYLWACTVNSCLATSSSISIGIQ